MDGTPGDAFAFLLDDLDHENLAQSLMLECAPPASAIAAALGQPAPFNHDTPALQPPPPPPPLPQQPPQPLNALGDLGGLFSSAGGLGALLGGGSGGLGGLLGGGGAGLGGLLGGGAGGLSGLLGGAGGLGALLGEAGGAGLGGLLDAFGGQASVLQLLQSPLVAPHQEQLARLMGGGSGAVPPTGAELLLQQISRGVSDDESYGDGETDVVSPPSVGRLSAFTTTDDSNTEDETSPRRPPQPKAEPAQAQQQHHDHHQQQQQDQQQQQIMAHDGDESPGQEQQPPRKAPMENSTRKRQKEELAYLREKVRELEAELSSMKDRARTSATGRPGAAKRLQTARGVAGSASSASGDDEWDAERGDDAATLTGATAAAAANASSAMVAAGKVSLWERVAKRQLIEKQKAEVKNQKLKEALEYQLKVAKSLEKVLKKRPGATLSTQVLESVQVVDSKRFCSLSRSEASIYDMLIANTAKVYAELDDVCARNEHMHVEEDVNDMKLMVDASNQLFMEVTHAKLIPFDMQTTINGVWRCLSLAQVPIADGGLYEAVERTHDTICAKSTMSIRVRNTEAIVYTRFVMKRFEEKDRTILVCESSTHSEGPREIVNGLKCLEKGWVVIRKASAKTKDGAPSTLIQLCMRMTPTISGDVLKSQRGITGAVTDIILGTFNKSLVLLYQTVENIIMETLAPAAATAVAVAATPTETAPAPATAAAAP